MRPLPHTSGMPLPLAAIRLRSFRPAYLCRCKENSDSIACADCTEIITSLDKYAILATIQKSIHVFKNLG